MNTPVAKTSKQTKKRAPALHMFELSAGMTAVERRGGTPEEIRATCGSMIARMRADKRKGDAVQFLTEFRNNPRG